MLIASTQIKDFFGLQLAKVPSEFWLRMKALFHAASTLSLTATLLAAGTVAVIAIRNLLTPSFSCVLLIHGCRGAA